VTPGQASLLEHPGAGPGRGKGCGERS
jgi:hypothetical protein